MMLHIHNGDSTANTMREAKFPGEHLAFSEALALGPTPQTASQDEWLTARANYLAGGSGGKPGDIRKALVQLDKALDEVNRYDEIVLWFEHDLLCQINLSYLLARFSHQDLQSSRLSLICIGEFPGIKNFRGLGQLTAAQMAELFDIRHIVTDAENQLAEITWASYRSPDPSAIAQLSTLDTGALPYLHDALLNHLSRYPSLRNGLSYAQNKLLEFIADGETEFVRLCRKFFDEEPAYGLGDFQVWEDLKAVARVKQPLVTISGFDDDQGASFTSRLHNTSFAITDLGNDVLNDESDFVEMNGIDLWLGGVHLQKGNLWRWDDGEQQLVAG